MIKDTQSGGAVQGIFLGGENLENGREEVLICARDPEHPKGLRWIVWWVGSCGGREPRHLRLRSD
jgi:hypothetical protein